MGLSGNKVFLPLSSTETVLARTVRRVLESGVCRGLVLIVREADIAEAELLLRSVRQAFPELHCIAALGGKTRQESVFCGLRMLADTPVNWVLIHDGARPFCSPRLIRMVAEAGMEKDAAILATPARQTLKHSKDGGVVSSTVPRAEVWEAQTPQVFAYELILRAHEHAARSGFVATDDSQLVEELGHPVQLVAGDDRNFKITTPFDLSVARAVLEENSSLDELGSDLASVITSAAAPTS